MKKNRAKRVFVKELQIGLTSFSGVVQIGDAQTIYPFTLARAIGGYRGAPSFTTMERAILSQTRLHLANQRDVDINDLNISDDHLPNP